MFEPRQRKCLSAVTQQFLWTAFHAEARRRVGPGASVGASVVLGRAAAGRGLPCVITSQPCPCLLLLSELNGQRL